MEPKQISELIKTTRSQQQSIIISNPTLNNISKGIEDGIISKYNDSPFTMKGSTNAISKLAKAFPTWDAGMTDVLLSRAKDYNFTDQRLMDAINYVIDTCKYPTPKIADIISFNKGVKVFNHAQMSDYVAEHCIISTDYFKCIKIEGKKPFWVLISEYEQYPELFKY